MKKSFHGTYRLGTPPVHVEKLYWHHEPAAESIYIYIWNFLLSNVPGTVLCSVHWLTFVLYCRLFMDFLPIAQTKEFLCRHSKHLQSSHGWFGCSQRKENLCLYITMYVCVMNYQYQEYWILHLQYLLALVLSSLEWYCHITGTITSTAAWPARLSPNTACLFAVISWTAACSCDQVLITHHIFITCFFFFI